MIFLVNKHLITTMPWPMGIFKIPPRALIKKNSPMRLKVSIFHASANVYWWRRAIFQYRSMKPVVCSVFWNINISLHCCVDHHQLPDEQALLDQLLWISKVSTSTSLATSSLQSSFRPWASTLRPTPKPTSLLRFAQNFSKLIRWA